jgi:DNA modification methylase
MPKLYHGDCVEIVNSLVPGSVDLVFADPPFNIGLKYDEHDDRMTPKAYVDWTSKWLDACVRALKPTGSMYVAISDEFAAEMGVALKSRLTMRNWLVWNYSFGQCTKKKFNRCKTHIFYFVKGRSFTWNGDEIKVPSQRQLKYADKRAKSGGKMPDDVWDVPSYEIVYSEREDALDAMPGGAQGVRPDMSDFCDNCQGYIGYGECLSCDGEGLPSWVTAEWQERVLKTLMGAGAGIKKSQALAMLRAASPASGPDEGIPTDVWKMSRLCGTFNERIRKDDGSVHPCQMPEAVLERIIKVSSNVGDVVLDPFGGTGTTAAVAQRLGRDWVTMDRSEGYCKVISTRLFGALTSTRFTVRR